MPKRRSSKSPDRDSKSSDSDEDDSKPKARSPARLQAHSEVMTSKNKPAGRASKKKTPPEAVNEATINDNSGVIPDSPGVNARASLKPTVRSFSSPTTKRREANPYYIHFILVNRTLVAFYFSRSRFGNDKTYANYVMRLRLDHRGSMSMPSVRKNSSTMLMV